MAESVGNRHPAVGSRAVITGIVPRYNFDELHYAFITTFQVLSLSLLALLAVGSR
jgi:hypothetical protein